MQNPTPGTLAEFDLVLSITQDALNAQFLHLFLTPLSDDGSQYLINHSMVLKASPNSKAGIFGSIECPQVLMNLPDIVDNARVVKLAFKFLTNTPGSPGDPSKGIPPYDPALDSTFKWWDESEDDPVLKSENINGWTFSFNCKLGQANIQEIEAKYLHPSTSTQLQNAIDNKSFQPASLFCLFETGTLASSFQMADAAGKPVRDQQAITNFIIAITSRFAPQPPDTTVATPGNGLPTPENPFVLGYGISQVDPKPLPQTPQFDPQNFQFSVTHQPNGFGTLNFLMLLGPITPVTDVTRNGSAGVFAVPFLKAIGADSPGPTNGPQYDGTLAVSAKAFKDQYIVKQLQGFFAIPNPSLQSVSAHTDSNTTNYTSLTSFATNNAWHSDTSGADDDYFNYNGTWNSTVSITSNYAGQQMPVDAARTLSIKASASYWIKYLQTVEASWKHLNPYSGTLSAETTVTPINLAYNVTTGSKGGWAFSIDASSTMLPPLEDDPNHAGQKRLILKEQNASGDGLQVLINTAGSFFNRDIFNPIALMDEVTSGLAPIAQSIWAMYQAQLCNSLSSLNNQIVLPVGNVFTFNGLSLDSQGNLLTLMKYQTQSGDGQTTDV